MSTNGNTKNCDQDIKTLNTPGAMEVTADTNTDEQIRELIMKITNAWHEARGRVRRSSKRISSLRKTAAGPTMQIAVIYSAGTDDSPRRFRACPNDSLWLDDGEHVAAVIEVGPSTTDMDLRSRIAEIVKARVEVMS